MYRSGGEKEKWIPNPLYVVKFLEVERLVFTEGKIFEKTFSRVTYLFNV